MTDEMKLLLKLLLEQETRNTEAGQKAKRRRTPEPVSGLDFPPGDQKKRKANATEEESRMEDLALIQRELYDAHNASTPQQKTVPIWEKYALSVTEAAQYFHIGIKKLREIIASDRYANYLIWNGGHVFIKRKLFEAYLDKKSEV